MEELIQLIEDQREEDEEAMTPPARLAAQGEEWARDERELASVCEARRMRVKGY